MRGILSPILVALAIMAAPAVHAEHAELCALERYYADSRRRCGMIIAMVPAFSAEAGLCPLARPRARFDLPW